MRIVHVVARGWPAVAGPARWCRDVSTALAAAGHEVLVLALVTARDRAEDAVAWGRDDLDAGVHVRRYRTAPALWGLNRLRRRRTAPPPRSGELRGALLEAVRAADVVHLHGDVLPEGRWAWLVARMARRPLLVTPGAGPEVPALVARADAVIVRDDGDVDRLRARGVPAARIVCVGRGQSPPARAPHEVPARLCVAPESRLLVFPGPCDEAHGALAVVDAARVLRLDGWRVVPVVAGAAYAPGARVRRLWQAGQVPVVEVPVLPPALWSALLAEAAAVVLPVGWDAAVASDAWTAGTPVLAPADDDGHDDGDLLGDAAVRFARGRPLALATEIARLLRDPERCGRLVERGRSRVARLPSWTTVAARVADVYAALARRRSDAPVAEPRRPAEDGGADRSPKRRSNPGRAL